MTLDGRPIAVIGAGIGGMAAALCLARRGAEVRVYERAAELGEVGAGLQIGPNGMKVLAKLGLARVLAGRATEPDAVEMRDGLTGRRIATVPFGQVATARYGAPYLQFHRADLLEALAGAATAAGVRFVFGADVEPQAPPEAELIVAADGVRSGFRAALNPGVAPAFTGQVAWRALVPAADLPLPDAARATQLYLGPGRHMVVYPLRGGSVWNIVAVEERAQWAGEGWHTSADPAALRAAFEGWCMPVERLTAAVTEGYLWGLFAHGPLPRWQDGRIALLGDACHPMLPFLAQGAVMALEDAWVLADRLASRAEQGDALAEYERLRKPRASRVQRAAARNARAYHLKNPALKLGAHAGLGLISGLLPSALLGGFDWLYGGDVTAPGAPG